MAKVQILPMSIDAIPSGRVLVIAPHPDDESLGCGGLLALLARQGSKFCVVFVTDGGASHPGSRRWPRSRLAACRKREALEALTRLGIPDASAEFCGLPDAAMPPPGTDDWEKTVAALEKTVCDFQPTLALLPWRRDPHCDHRDSWLIATEALKRAHAHPLILEYAVWLEEFGNAGDRPRETEAKAVVVDVGAALPAKRAAIAAHRSQTTDLIDDDPQGFRLAPETIARLTTPTETYWQSLDEAD